MTQQTIKPPTFTNQVYDAWSLQQTSSTLIKSDLDGVMIRLQGFYLDQKKSMYGKFYYDLLTNKERSATLTLQVSEEIKATLIDGAWYELSGFVNRTRLKDDFSLKLIFYITNVEKLEREIQLISENEYNLIKRRYDVGMVDVESILLSKFRMGQKPRIALITGNASIVENDFNDQLIHSDEYNLEVLRVNLSTKTELLALMKNWNRNVDLIAFVRGGGSGLTLFDEEDLCNAALNVNIPFVTAIGHEVDTQVLSKIADRSFATPSTFGTFLEKTFQLYKSEQKRFEDLEEKMQLQAESFQDLIGDKEKKIAKAKRWLRDIVIMALLIIAGLSLYIYYFNAGA